MSTGLYMSTQLDVGLFPVSPNALSSVAVSYATIFSCPLKQPELGWARIRFPPKKEKVHYYDRRKVGFKADVQDALTIAG